MDSRNIPEQRAQDPRDRALSSDQPSAFNIKPERELVVEENGDRRLGSVPKDIALGLAKLGFAATETSPGMYVIHLPANEKNG
jgi:hypothetical protein